MMTALFVGAALVALIALIVGAWMWAERNLSSLFSAMDCGDDGANYGGTSDEP